MRGIAGKAGAEGIDVRDGGRDQRERWMDFFDKPLLTVASLQ